jgi:hypothetical protein
MDQLTRFFEVSGGQGDQLGTVEVVFALVLSLACTSCIAIAYRYTHRAADYSQSYVTALILMGLVTTLIMIVIGSNIARAFSLVGALSIVRFRNAVKETRDVAFIYFVMAIAMACGTRFYAVAIVACLLIIAVLLVLHMANFGASTRTRERLLTVQLRGGVDAESVLKDVLDELFEKHAVVSVENARQGLYTEVVLSVSPKPHVSAARVLDAISRLNENLKIRYGSATNTDDV